MAQPKKRKATLKPKMPINIYQLPMKMESIFFIGSRNGSLQLKSLLSGDFSGGAVVKNPPANAGDMGSSPGPGRSHMPWSN